MESGIMRKSLLIIGVVLFINCISKNEKKFYYEEGQLLSKVQYNDQGLKNGELREYYKSGELKTIEYYRNGKLMDTTRGFYKDGKLSVKIYGHEGKTFYEKYYENGAIMSNGEVIDTILKGWWSFYDSVGKLQRKVEYLDLSKDENIKNKQYPNQTIYYTKNGTILSDSSNYFTISLKDTLPLRNLTLGKIDLEPLISKKSDFYMVYFWSQDEQGNKTKIDSTYGKNAKEAEFWLIPQTKGKHTLNGYILEKGKTLKINKNDTSLVDVIDSAKKLFFEKKFYVKDTLE